MKWYELTPDGKKLALRKSDDLYVIDSSFDRAGLSDKVKVDLQRLELPAQSPRRVASDVHGGHGGWSAITSTTRRRMA